jgi:hypothetical protein
MPYHLICLYFLFFFYFWGTGSLFFFNLKQKESRFFKKLGSISNIKCPLKVVDSFDEKNKTKNNSK